MRQAALMNAEAERLLGVVQHSEGWIAAFQPADAAEEETWRRSEEIFASLEGRGSDPATLASQLVRRAEDGGIERVRVAFADPSTDLPALGSHTAGRWTLAPVEPQVLLSFRGEYEDLLALAAALPPQATVEHLRVVRTAAGIAAEVQVAGFRPTSR